MQQLDLLDSQAQLVAASISGRVGRIHEALHQLAAMSAALFDATSDDPAAIAAWIEAEGFGVDPKGGFFERAAHLERLRARSAEGVRADPAVDPMSFLWPPSRADDPTTRFHFFAQRGLGPALEALRGRFPDVVWIYYQDDTNGAIIAPALDGVTAIPPEFDWHGYHSFMAAEPSNNPERAVRWSPPNIDYGGHGLIICASMPVYHRGRFAGVWSMDVPLNSVRKGALGALPVAAEDGFIASYDGHLMAHRSIETVIAKEGGSVYRERIEVLPVIEVGDGVLAVPLVGSVREDRAAHLLARVLADVARLRARAVVVDLTGAAEMDLAAADDLMRLERAVRLLGARCVFSGISSELAAALAGASLDLQRIESFATLKAALAGALRARGR